MRDTLYRNHFYASEYLSQIDPLAPKMWNAQKDSEKLEGEVLKTGGTLYSIKGINYVLYMYMHFGFTNCIYI